MINDYRNLKSKELITMEKESAIVSEAKIVKDAEGKDALTPAVKVDVYKATVSVYAPDGEITPQTVNFDLAAVDNMIERLNSELVLFNEKIADLEALKVDMAAM